MIADLVTPITTGLTPQPAGTGRLSKRREAELRERLRQLDAARRSAVLASRHYLILPVATADTTTTGADHV